MWQGRLRRTREWLCIIKTKESRFDAVQKGILKSHNYSLPQITATYISKGSKSYLGWISGEVE